MVSQYSAASLHIYQEEDDLELPTEAFWCFPRYPRPQRPWFWAPSIFSLDPKEGDEGEGEELIGSPDAKGLSLQTPISAEGLFMRDI